MLKGTTAVTTAVLSAILAITGCGGTEVPSEETGTSTNPLGATPDTGRPTPLVAPERGRGLDSRFEALARDIPGFGGMFLDEEGTPTVLLVDLKQEPGARAALREELRSRGLENAGLKVRQAKYDFRQLGQWREQASSVLSLPGVVSTDVDESSNRVRIGVRDVAAQRRVEAELSRLGIPREAVEVEERLPATFALTTLRSHYRPLAGGLQIAFGNNSLCTLGLIGTRQGDYSDLLAITNSHCTYTQGGVEGTLYYQPTVSSENLIGTEVADPEYFTGGACPQGRRCRYSDSALISLNRSGPNYWNALGGRIAKASSPCCGLPAIYFSEDTYWHTAREVAYPLYGEGLTKIGRTTGKSAGTVYTTCENANVADSYGYDTGITLLCQASVRAKVDSGDSGSPVFSQPSTGSEVNFYGILWGGRGTSEFLFSPIGAIEQELGPLDTW